MATVALELEHMRPVALAYATCSTRYAIAVRDSTHATAPPPPLARCCRTSSTPPTPALTHHAVQVGQALQQLPHNGQGPALPLRHVRRAGGDWDVVEHFNQGVSRVGHEQPHGGVVLLDGQQRHQVRVLQIAVDPHLVRYLCWAFQGAGEVLGLGP